MKTIQEIQKQCDLRQRFSMLQNDSKYLYRTTMTLNLKKKVL